MREEGEGEGERERGSGWERELRWRYGKEVSVGGCVEHYGEKGGKWKEGKE